MSQRKPIGLVTVVWWRGFRLEQPRQGLRALLKTGVARAKAGCRSRRVTNRPLEQLRRHVGLIQSDAESVFLTNRRYLCSEDS